MSLRDNVKARKLTGKGVYERKAIDNETPYRSQFAFTDIHSWKH